MLLMKNIELKKGVLDATPHVTNCESKFLGSKSSFLC